ncbi:tyrosine-type recombinase/integrase [Cedecea sp. NFIX57]|uniref:tyrosine-type recombinase/integrase n=1 Tax=Cedecea sp. NFIX57 TaxID=1566286 RepID=UPI000A0D130F|nr:tyrosine-type recombinase/integrase [Cedecea sp. NFIX57]SMG61818.1 Integrase [Cedecea sp. NFIX57]
MTLTDRQIRALRPTDRTYKTYDARGLFIQVTPRGVKTWYYRYNLGGKDKKISLGLYPEISLVAARDKITDLRRMVMSGVDPLMSRREDKRRETSAQLNTLPVVIDEWMRLNCTEMAENTRLAYTRNTLHIYRYFGNKPVAELTTPELFDFIVHVRDTRGANVASHVLSVLKRSLQQAVLRGMIAFNPARELAGTAPRPKSVNRAALPASQIGQFLDDLERYRTLHPFTRLALRLLMLTFVRPGELCGAEWSEISLDERRWVIPAHRMKMRREHTVPLSTQAIEVLRTLHGLSGNNRFVFPSESKKRHVPPSTLVQAMERMCYRGTATPHGFRALASSTLNENGFISDVIERQLAHMETNKIRAAYNRAEYLEERTRMMQWWADFIDEQRRK